jgi:hypothetical protein
MTQWWSQAVFFFVDDNTKSLKLVKITNIFVFNVKVRQNIYNNGLLFYHLYFIFKPFSEECNVK